MTEWVIDTSSPEETAAWGEFLGRRAEADEKIWLLGSLGAGKTHFAKGFAKGLEIVTMVNSPSFTIVKEYEGRLPLFHIDLYRLSEEEAEEIGIEEYFEAGGVSLLEWPTRLEEWPGDRLEIDIQYTGETSRQLTLTAVGERWKAKMKELQNDEDARN